MNNSEGKSETGLLPVIQHLEDSPGEHGLTADKVRRRAKLILDPEWPGWVVFEMERHQPTLGPIGSAGTENASWVAARRRYAFDPLENKLVEIAIVGRPVLDCNVEGLAIEQTADLAFSCTQREDDRIVCEEICSNTKEEVFSREGAIEFGRSIVENWTFEGLSFETHGLDLGSPLGNAISALHHKCAELAGEAAATAWDDMDLP